MPDRDESCVWMRAGLVSWKLCDRGFDCENCPLDLSLRPSVVQGRPEFPDDRRYHPAHTWAHPAEDGVRVGMDRFAAGLLCRPDAVVLLPPGAGATRDLPGAWVQCDRETLPLAMPATGRVLRTNPCLADHPWMCAADPYGQGWLLELRTEDGLGELLDARGICATTALHRQLLRDRAMALLHPVSGVGATAADGGQPLPWLRDHLPRHRWAGLVRDLLSTHLDPTHSEDAP